MSVYFTEFMTSPEFNQNVAFGILRDRDVDGTPLVMPKMIRTRSKRESINLCRRFVNEQGLECPSDRTMYTYLENMPAGSQKIMKGTVFENSFKKSHFHHYFGNLLFW